MQRCGQWALSLQLLLVHGVENVLKSLTIVGIGLAFSMSMLQL